MDTETLVEAKGRVVKEPELRFLADGTACCSMVMPLSTSRQGVDTKPYWLQISTFGTLADKVAQSVVIGDMIVIKGRLSASRWLGENNVEKANLGVVAYAVGKAVSLSEPVVFMYADKKQKEEKTVKDDKKKDEDGWTPEMKEAFARAKEALLMAHKKSHEAKKEAGESPEGEGIAEKGIPF